ncbi:MAG: hypothetical protein ACRDYC_13980 [Acidimicrobiales bacterium]
MPFEPKARAPGLDAALVELRVLQERFDRQQAQADRDYAALAAAVSAALELGATLRELAGVLGWSPEGVRKIALRGAEGSSQGDETV